MAETLLSPGLLMRENDISFQSPTILEAGAAIIGPTVKGPVEIPTRVTSYSEYQRVFGTTFASGSNKYEYFTSLAVKSYFNQGGDAMLVTRVVPSGSTFTSAASTGVLPMSGSTVPFELETIGQGTIFNNSGSLNSDGSLVSGSADNVRWEVSNVNQTAGTFSLSIRRGDDSTKNKIILETFSGLSLDPNTENYIERVIGNQTKVKTVVDGTVYIDVEGDYPNRSKYVRVSAVTPTLNYLANDGVTVNTDSLGVSYSKYLPKSGSGSFAGATGDLFPAGTNNFFEAISGTNSQGLTADAYTDAISVLSNSEEYLFKVLVAPGLAQEFTAHATPIASLVAMAEERGDCVFVPDLTGFGASVSEVVGEAIDINSSYAATYWPWLQVPSETGKNVYVPASTVIPGVYAFSDKVGAPWYAPAGTLRGSLTGVVQPEKKLRKSDKDTLYQAGVNPIATLPGEGITIYGQNTLQKKKSHLSKVNVRRLLIELKEKIGGFAMGMLFEQNTISTRNKFLAKVTPYLDSVVERQGLYAYEVIMDERLNTPDVIDRNQIIGQIRIQPTSTIEFIILDFVVTPTGVQFGE